MPRKNDPRVIGDLANWIATMHGQQAATQFLEDAGPGAEKATHAPKLTDDGSFNDAPCFMAAWGRWDELERFFRDHYVSDEGGWQANEFNSSAHTGRVLVALARGAAHSPFMARLLDTWCALLSLMAVSYPAGMPKRTYWFGGKPREMRPTLVDGPYVMPTGMRGNADRAAEPSSSAILAVLLGVPYTLSNAMEQLRDFDRVPKTWDEYVSADDHNALHPLAGLALIAERCGVRASRDVRDLCRQVMGSFGDRSAAAERLVDEYVKPLVRVHRSVRECRIQRATNGELVVAIAGASSRLGPAVVASRSRPWEILAPSPHGTTAPRPEISFDRTAARAECKGGIAGAVRWLEQPLYEISITPSDVSFHRDRVIGISS